MPHKNRLAGSVLNFKPPRPKHTLKIRGRDYALSDVGSSQLLVEDDLELPEDGGATLIDLEHPEPFRFLWVLAPKNELRMWRITDGDDKVHSRASADTSMVLLLERKGHLNRVDADELRAIESEMDRIADRHLRLLQDSIEKNKSRLDRIADEAALKVFEREVRPELERTFRDIDRGVFPFWFKSNPRVMDVLSPEQQARSLVFDKLFSSQVTTETVDAELRRMGVDPDAPGVDSQLSYWALNDLRDSIAARYLERSKLAAKSKYQDKKKIEGEDGEERTVYVYSERQVANRHREKAERVEKLRKSISDLRAQVKRDLKSDDALTRLSALAVGLINETFERVGNDQSASEGHFGVTGWRKKHLSFGDGKVTIKYVGKSGVKQEKVVEDAGLVRALRECCEGKKADDVVLCLETEDGDEVRVTSEDVNNYLEPFKVTAKDLRGYHANREMLDQLKAQRAEGPELPRGRSEKDGILKEEFEEALELAAEAVGHESSTLRNQYLVPNLEDEYMHDGTVDYCLDKTASADDPLDDLTAVCTSNEGKLRELRALGLGHLLVISRDLPEPDSDPLTVVRVKVAQVGPGVLVDDASLDVDGHDVGVNVRWLSAKLPSLVGHRALFRVVLGFTDFDGVTRLYVGEVEGSIAPPRGDGFGFDPFFLPDGATRTLGESKPSHLDPRALAVRALLSNRPTRTYAAPASWDGPWQGDKRVATKTRAEREEEEAQRLLRDSPGVKPPRKDRMRNVMEVDVDPDDERDKDLSMNRADVGG